MNQTNRKPTLDDRIAAAFSADTKSGDVVELIREAEAAVKLAGESAQSARAEALDPALSTERVAIARREMEDAAFRRDRMQMAVTKLNDRLRELRAEEDDQRRWLAYEKAKKERDKLAGELTETYPVFACQIAVLLTRIVVNDRDIEFINADRLPSGADRLLVAELIARGLKGFVDNSANIPRITSELRLPDFKYNRHDPYTWPPSR